MKPLEGLTVLDFSVFLAGPVCALRLADLGARVIKVERPDGGDLCRSLYISEHDVDGDSTLFHSINRNKESFAANLKAPEDAAAVRELIKTADVLITNFRPGVMDRIGFGYDAVRELNPRLVYGSISGYGDEGPWVRKPGQDLLAQALSGVMWLTGDGALGEGDEAAPVPMGLAVADMFAGHFMAQGLLALLVRRGVTGEGGLVEVSLLEAMLDFQFEVLTTHLNDGGRMPERSAVGNGHAYLSAPYGVYKTADGWLAVAMCPLPKLGEVIGLPALDDYDATQAFRERDTIKGLIAAHLKTQTTDHWLGLLEPADLWCAPVLDWPALMEHEAFSVLDWPQRITRPDGQAFTACRCPLRIDRSVLKSTKHAPSIGEQTQAILQELGRSPKAEANPE
ncbi:MAG: CaiB/BaiF CoA-transferase family protein [Planctomycetota bacterium]